jgi:hypothetical protein
LFHGYGNFERNDIVEGEVTIPLADNEQVEPEADEAEVMQRLREELQSLTVSDHLVLMMQSLSALAVDRMGLTEQTGGRGDLSEARLAIDAFKALLELAGKTRPPEEMTAHRGVLSQLQMSYVGMLAGVGTEEVSSAGAEEAPSGQGVDEAAEGPGEAPVETPADASADVPPETSPDASREAPPETPTDEAPAASPAGSTDEQPTGAPTDKPTDAPNDEAEDQG